MKEKNRMSRGKIKIILFLIVFLLTLAVVCNLLIDLSEQKAAANATPAPIVTGSDNPSSSGTVVVETAPPVTIAPVTPTPKPVYSAPITPIDPVAPESATPAPSESILPVPTATPVPADTVIGSGQFMSDTGLPINITADWTATVVDDSTVKVTISVDLSSYSLFISESPPGVYVSVGDQFKSGATPAVEHPDNTLIITHLCTTEHILKLSNGNTSTFPVAVEYHFNGVYKQQELPVIECGGEITLSR